MILTPTLIPTCWCRCLCWCRCWKIIFKKQSHQHRHQYQYLHRHWHECRCQCRCRCQISMSIWMVLYGITLVPLAEELRAADPVLLFPFYADDAAFDGSAQRSAQLLKLLTKKGPDRDISPSRLSPSLYRTPQGKRKWWKKIFQRRGYVWTSLVVFIT